MKVFLDALGCRLNQAEIDRLAQQLRAAGHQPVASPGEAEWTVINTCAVARQAERDSRRRVRHAYSRNPSGRIAVTGCWATLRARRAADLPGVARVIADADKDRGAPLLGLSPFGRPADLDLGPIARVPLPGMRHRTRAFVRAQDGCDRRCAFCIATLARGPARSRPVSGVLDDVRAAVAGGAREAVLTGVPLGAYGLDRGQPDGLAGLVRHQSSAASSQRPVTSHQ